MNLVNVNISIMNESGQRDDRGIKNQESECLASKWVSGACHILSRPQIKSRSEVLCFSRPCFLLNKGIYANEILKKKKRLNVEKRISNMPLVRRVINFISS